MPTLVLLKPVDPTVQSTFLHFLIFQYFKAQVMLSYCVQRAFSTEHFPAGLIWFLIRTMLETDCKIRGSKFRFKQQFIQQGTKSIY